MIILKGVGGTFKEFYVFSQHSGVMGTDDFLKARIVKGFYGDSPLIFCLGTSSEQVNLFFVEIVNTFKGLAHADGP